MTVDGTVLSVALPTLAEALHATASDLEWFSSGYLLLLAAATLPAGLIGDRFGRKKLLAAASRRSARAPCCAPRRPRPACSSPPGCSWGWPEPG